LKRIAAKWLKEEFEDTKG